jgi:hypothetical protein
MPMMHRTDADQQQRTWTRTALGRPHGHDNVESGSGRGKEVARIDAKIKKNLLKRARKHGMTEAEGIELAEMWKHAARSMKHQHLGSGRHKAH